MIIGLISDTHGLLREEVIENLLDCDLIIHAGDIGKIEVIDKLRKISKTEYIRGNCDRNINTNFASDDKIIDVMGRRIYLIHDIEKINIDLKKENISIVVYGHSHKGKIYEHDGILYINPGSVGPRRFKLPIEMAKLTIGSKYIDINVKNNIIRYKDYIVEQIVIK